MRSLICLISHFQPFFKTFVDIVREESPPILKRVEELLNRKIAELVVRSPEIKFELSHLLKQVI